MYLSVCSFNDCKQFENVIYKTISQLKKSGLHIKLDSTKLISFSKIKPGILSLFRKYNDLSRVY